jgi:hypothetical protein
MDPLLAPIAGADHHEVGGVMVGTCLGERQSFTHQPRYPCLPQRQRVSVFSP